MTRLLKIDRGRSLSTPPPRGCERKSGDLMCSLICRNSFSLGF